MKHPTLFTLFTVCLIGVSSAKATLLHLDAQATMTEGLPFSLTFIPIGTTVTTYMDFDLGPGDPSPLPRIKSSSGWFRWTKDGIPLEFTVDRAYWQSTNYSTFMYLSCAGTGPNEGDIRVSGFTIVIDIGVRPWETTAELKDLLLTSSITKVTVGASKDGWGQSGYLETNVSGNIYLIPEPTTLLLLGMGGVMMRKRK